MKRKKAVAPTMQQLFFIRKICIPENYF